MKCYQYKGVWIEIFLEPQGDRFEYVAYIETPNQDGVITCRPMRDIEHAEFGAEEVIDSWN